MGSGSWYGVPNYGEFVEVYYNKDAFAAAGLEVPTTLDEFEDVLQAFADQGITPLAESAAEYPLGQLWYQLALTKADRSFVDDYQLYTGDVDWEGDEITYATETIKDWTDKGYISTDASGLKAEDAGVGFINGDVPDLLLGQLVAQPVHHRDRRLRVGHVPLPRAPRCRPARPATCGSSPRRAKNKDLADEFIDITMRPEIQALIGNNGGVPVAADPADITDEKSAELIANFNALTERDGIAFYPDWPTADVLRRAERGPAGARQRHQVARRGAAAARRAVPGRRRRHRRLTPADAAGRSVRRSPRHPTPERKDTPWPSPPTPGRSPPADAATPRARRAPSSQIPGSSRNAYWLYLVPGLALLTIIIVIPLVWNVYLTFTDYRGIRPPEWIGLENWIELAGDAGVLDLVRQLHRDDRRDGRGADAARPRARRDALRPHRQEVRRHGSRASCAPPTTCRRSCPR